MGSRSRDGVTIAAKKIVVVGSINVDLVARVKRLPALGETITGLGFETFCGGKGANQAVAAARLGAPVMMVGKLGDDVFAGELRAGLAAAGIDAAAVDTVPGPSGTALIVTTREGENSIVVIPGANGRLLPEDIDRYRVEISEAAIVLAQLEVPLETVEFLGRIVGPLGIPFLLDPAPVCSLTKELLHAVTWLTPNETEARLLLQGEGVEIDLSSAETVVRGLLKLGVRNVVLKRGGKGVYMDGADVSACSLPAFQVEAVDTTAAGDAFNGAFAYALAIRKMAPRRAAEFASGVAAISVTRAGAQASMPMLSEVEDFFARQQTT